MTFEDTIISIRIEKKSKEKVKIESVKEQLPRQILIESGSTRPKKRFHKPYNKPKCNLKMERNPNCQSGRNEIVFCFVLLYFYFFCVWQMQTILHSVGFRRLVRHHPSHK